MEEKLGWGIVATGGIAATIAEDLRLLPEARLAAVSSRSMARATEFAAAHGAAAAYDSYEDLAADPGVDVVYVANPHPQHFGPVKAALEAGKAVLNEKAFTSTLADAETLVAMARERDLFLMEAMWTRFNPLVSRLRELVGDGAIGTVRQVWASNGHPVATDPENRFWNPAIGGGALLDMGVYPVSFAHMILGEPSQVTAMGTIAESGVDAEVSLMLGWPDGQRAHLGASMISPMPTTAAVIGTSGRVDVAAHFQAPTRMTLHRLGHEPEDFGLAQEGRGYVWQLREVDACVRAGRTESEIMPLHDTLAVMRTLQTTIDKLQIAVVPGS